MSFTRRDWILGSLGSTAWPAIAAAQDHAHRMAAAPPGSAKFEFFDEKTAADVSAIASQILPSTDGPGANEAGVVYFIDRALTTFDSGKQDAYRRGMVELQARRTLLFPASHNIAGLSSAQQHELVRSIEKTEFFETLRVHTLLGFLGNPSYGGNRGKVGWQYIHFEDRMSWQPPFGYYDAEAK